jgi:hypothetical protein
MAIQRQKPNKKEVAGKPIKETTSIEYNKKFTESSKKINANVKSGALEKSGVVSKDSKATVKPYEKKFIPADKGRTYALVVDGKGSTVKTANKKLGSDTANKRLYKEFQRDSTDTMNRRNANLNFVKVNTGKKESLTTKDVNSLKDMGKIKVNKKK